MNHVTRPVKGWHYLWHTRDLGNLEPVTKLVQCIGLNPNPRRPEWSKFCLVRTRGGLEIAARVDELSFYTVK